MLNRAVKYNFGKGGSNYCFNGLSYFTLTTNDPIIEGLRDWSASLHGARQTCLSLIYLSSLIDSCDSKTEDLWWISGQSFCCHSRV